MKTPTWSVASFVLSVVQGNGKSGNHYGKKKTEKSLMVFLFHAEVFYGKTIPQLPPTFLHLVLWLLQKHQTK